MKNSDRIIAEFESGLKAGKNPSLRKFSQSYPQMDDETLGILIMLRALYDYKEKMKLPERFKKKQKR